MLGLTSLGYGISGFMEAFRYRSEDKFYDSYKIGSNTEYYKLADQIRNYSALGIGMTLGVTGILAGFGIATGINLMLMGYLGLAAGIIGMVVGVLRFLAYEQGYSNKDSSTAAEATAAAYVMGGTKWDGIRDMLMDAGAAITMAGAAESIAYEMWHMMSDEDQQTAVKEWEEAAATLADSVEEMRQTAGLDGKAEGKEEKAEEEEGEDAEEGEGDEEAADEGEEDAGEED